VYWRCCNLIVPLRINGPWALDGGPLAELKTGTYVYADRPAGQHQIAATAALFPGVSQRDISTQTGRTYFFLARPSERSKVLGGMSAAGGVAGLLVGAAITSNNSNPGPLDFFPWMKTPHERRLPNFDWRHRSIFSESLLALG
jgi:hypothetical protein